MGVVGRRLENSDSTSRTLKVAVPAYGCFDLVTAAVGANVRVLFYDIDPATLGPDTKSLHRVLDLGAQAVVVAPQFGSYPDWEALQEVTSGHGAILIEDAAQSFGTMLGDQQAGMLGPLSVMSFGRGKGWTGLGGGALLTDETWKEAAPEPPRGKSGILRGGLLGAAVTALSRPLPFRLIEQAPFLGIGQTRYRAPGPVEAISEMSANLALETLSDSIDALVVQQESAAYYRAHLGSSSVVTPVAPVSGCRPGYLRYPVRVTRGVVDRVAREARGLGVRRGYPSILPALGAVQAICLNQNDAFPGAQELVDTLITLPTHGRLRPSDRESLVTYLCGMDSGTP